MATKTRPIYMLYKEDVVHKHTHNGILFSIEKVGIRDKGLKKFDSLPKDFPIVSRILLFPFFSILLFL